MSWRLDRVEIAVASQREEENVGVAEQDDHEAGLIAEPVGEKTLNLRNDRAAYDHGNENS